MAPVWKPYQDRATKWWKETATGSKIRLAAFSGAGLAVLIVGGRLITSPHWTPLYTQLSAKNAGAVTTELSALHTPYTLQDGGSTIEVPAKDINQTRITLAEKDLPSQSTATIPTPQKFTLGETSQEIQLNQMGGLESSLAATINHIQGLSGSHVVITQPPEDLFGESGTPATASVFVDVTPGLTLNPSQVSGIQNLVASAVSGLTPQHVSIVDQYGTLLTSKGAASSANATTNETQAELNATTNWEDYEGGRVQSLLSQVYGPGSVVARVHMQLGFQQQTAHSTTMSKPVISQQQITTSKSTATTANVKATGVAGNTPTYPVSSASTPQNSANSNTITRYAVPTTTKTTITPPGTVTKETAAVVIDKKLSPAETASIKNLVAQTLGVSPAVIAVSGLIFNTQAANSQALAMAKAEKLHQEIEWAIAGFIGLIILGLLISIIRKRRKQLAAPSSPSVTIGEAVSEQTQAINQSHRQALQEWATEDPQAMAKIIQGLLEQSEDFS